jgi:hypothetical protein
MQKSFKFSQIDDKRGYPFFALSSFSVWIAYKDGNNRTRYSIETSTTIAQLIHGRITEFKLDKTQGLKNLIEMVNRQSKHIKTAVIYWKGFIGESNKKIYEYKNDQWISHTSANIDNPLILKLPFEIRDKQIFMTLSINDKNQ